MLKRLSFRTRIFIGFGSLLVLLLISTLISINYVNRIYDSSNLINKHPQTVLAAVRDIQINTLNINHLMRDLLDVTDSIRIANIDTSIIKLDKNTAAKLIILKDRFLGDAKDISIIEKIYKDWKMIRDDAISNIKDKKYSQGQQTIRSLDDDYVHLLSSKYDFVEEYASGKAEEHFAIIDTNMKETKDFLIYASILMLLIASAITFLISNSISKPIKKLLARTVEIHKFDLEKNISQYDEQSLLESTINELNNFYENENKKTNETLINKQTIEKQAEELRILNKELENKVLLRTEEVAQSFHELRESKDILQSYLDSSPDPIIVLDENAKLTFVSRSTLQIFGLEDGIDLSTVEIFDFIHPEDKEIVGNSLNKLIKTGEPTNPLIRMFKKGGSIINVQTNSSFIKNDEGKVSILIIAHDITKSKLMEEELKKNELQTRTILNTIPEMVWLKDLNGIYISCNHRFERFFGAKQIDIVGKSDYDFVDKELADQFREKDNEAILAGKPTINIEEVTYADDGHKEILETIKTPVFDEENKLIGVLGTARDITEHLNLERTLSENEKRYQRSQSIGKVGNWEYNIKTSHFWASEETKRIYGFALDIDAFSSEDVESCIPDRIEVHQSLVDLIENDKEYNLEFDIITKDKGIRKTIHSIAVMEKNSDGEPFKISGIITDITKRKQIENALKESETKYKILFDKSIIPILILENNKFIDCNQAAIKILHSNNKDGILNTHPSELSPERQPDGRLSIEKGNEMIKIAIENGHHSFLWDHRRLDGEVLPVEVTLTVLSKNNEALSLISFWRELKN